MILATDRDKCAHLLRRFGLGASEAELDYYLQGGLNGAIDKLLNYEAVDEGFTYAPDDFSNQKGVVKMPGLQAWWMLRLVQTRRPLQEKMTIFWHDHFATSASKVTGPMLMLAQNEILRKNATGNFKTLLREASKDAAMLYWLDNQYNVKGKPNENFAREVMELFTLGIGHYTEKDIQESARAFTGWSFGGRRRNAKNAAQAPKGATFVVNEEEHDDGEKTVLGKTGNFDGDDILDMLCENPRTAQYITTKMWEWFAYPNPEPALIDRLAGKFKSSGLNIQMLVRDIMQANEFYSDKAVRAIYKNPVDFVVPAVRQMGMGQLVQEVQGEEGQTRPTQGQARVLQISTRAMGMDLLYPPDVAGWDAGPAWITSATMIERVKFADRVFGQAPSGLKGQKGGANVNLRYPAYALLQDEPTPEGIVKKLLSIYDAPLRPEKTANLVAAANKALAGGPLTATNAGAVAAGVTRLIFGAPEFQFS